MNLENYSIFKGLNYEEINIFRSKIVHKDIHVDDIIIHEGDKGDSIIFLFGFL